MFKANFLSGLGRGDTGKIEYYFDGPVDYSYEREGEFGEVHLNISVQEDDDGSDYSLNFYASLETEGATVTGSFSESLAAYDAFWF